MQTKVYFAKKGDFGLIAYENQKHQNVFLQVAAIDYAPQINEMILYLLLLLTLGNSTL